MKCGTVCSRQQRYWTDNSVCARKSEFSSGVFSQTSKKSEIWMLNATTGIRIRRWMNIKNRQRMGAIFGCTRQPHCTALQTEPRNNNAALPSSRGAEITVVKPDTFEDQPQRKSLKILTAVQVKNTSSSTAPGPQIKGCQKWAAADKEHSSGEQLAAALSHSWDGI